jgi:hypothetical protein
MLMMSSDTELANLHLETTQLSSRDATLRREVKFALPNVDFGKFRSILDVNCRRVSYGKRATSRVMSLYLDDAQLSSCQHNLDGTPGRSKIRLRWYDVPRPGRQVYFEVKRRAGEASTKERVSIHCSDLLESFEVRGIVEALIAVLPAPQAELLRMRCEPVLVTEYQRTYFEARGEPLRVTVDTHLAFYRAGGGRLHGRFPVRVPELVILEAKSPVGGEHRLRELLLPLEPWVTRSSKYVMGCQYLGLLPGSHFGPI